MITEGCEVYGDVDFSVLFSGVTIEENAVVRDSIIMPNSVIKSGAVIQYAIVAENSVVEENAAVGQRPEDMENVEDWGVAVVGAGIKIGKGAVVAPKMMVEEDMKGEDEK